MLDDFLASCNEAATFPINLVHHNTYEHNLRGYKKRLDDRELQLLSIKEKASLALLEYDAHTQKSISIRGLKQLRDHLNQFSTSNEPEPLGRYVFLHAPNSRERLYTSRELLTYILTYHQVMPSFLDFLFPFGRQEHVIDFHFSAFRQESHLDVMYKRLQIPQLQRSGIELRMCYCLKSVEPSEYQPSMPWSIRQTAVYHSLDLETGQTFWIIVKADELIRDRIEDTRKSSKKLLGTSTLQENAFTSSLATHMIICDWCAEDWRWYISFLEEALQEKTRTTLAVIVDAPTALAQERASKAVTWSTITSKSSTMSEKRSLQAMNNSRRRTSTAFSHPASQPSDPNFVCGAPPLPPLPLPPGGPPGHSQTIYDQRGASINPTKFSFADLQHVQLIEDRANEVLLSLALNVKVLAELQDHYHSLLALQPSHEAVIRDNKADIERFEARIASIVNDLHMQQSRTTTLLRLLADRKRLLYGILEYQNMEASKSLAMRAQQSTENMELMTKDMHILAQRTKQETVSMRIITLVTLFFLPGTFISTIMSTDIVQWHTDDTGKSQRVFQLGALQLFLGICIPIMVVTFVAWYSVYWWVNRKEEMKRRGQLALIEREV